MVVRYAVGMSLLLSLATACGNNIENVKQESVQTEAVQAQPVTLQVAYTGSVDEVKSGTESAIMKAKLPNVSYEYVLLNANKIAEAVAAGTPPDLIVQPLTNLPQLMSIKLPASLSGLIKENRIDLSKYSDIQLKLIKSYDPNGDLVAFPSASAKGAAYNGWALLYNKDIFDKFAVSHPQDGMTWDEIADLAKRLTREDQGVSYKGAMVWNSALRLPQQLNLPFVNKQNKVDLSGQGWDTVFRLLKRFYEEQGNYLPDKNGIIDEYLKNSSKVAMFVGKAEAFYEDPSPYEGKLNWDIVTYPQFVKNQRLIPPDSKVWIIASSSKNKVEAMKTVDILNSDELLSRNLALWDNPLLKKRNYKALMNLEEVNYVADPYTTPLTKVIIDGTNKMLTDNTDVNTARRTISEAMQKSVDETNSQ